MSIVGNLALTFLAILALLNVHQLDHHVEYHQACFINMRGLNKYVLNYLITIVNFNLR
jgi:hypothetical protein